MKTNQLINDEKGFTLLESIIVVTLVLLGVGGIFSGWYLMESRDRSLESYWRSKETLEVAFQVTHQTLRTTAQRSSISIINSGQGITFIGTDGVSRTFTKEGNEFKYIANGKEEVLISDTCDNAVFLMDGDLISITIGVTTPPNWNGKDDLNIEGMVYVRNP